MAIVIATVPKIVVAISRVCTQRDCSTHIWGTKHHNTDVDYQPCQDNLTTPTSNHAVAVADTIDFPLEIITSVTWLFWDPNIKDTSAFRGSGQTSRVEPGNLTRPEPRSN